MKRAVLAATMVAALAGCKLVSPPMGSAKTIVHKVIDAGFPADDLKHADVAYLSVWLHDRSGVGKDIAGQCKTAMKSDINWKLSDEGRICLADKFAGF
jgi:hypothetical protein